MKLSTSHLLIFLFPLSLAACPDNSAPPTTAQNQPPPPYGAPPYGQPPYPYGQSPYQPLPPPYGQPPNGQPQPPGPNPPAPGPQRPILPPLIGPVAWQAEAQAVVSELKAALPQGAPLFPGLPVLPGPNRDVVANVPLVFDPNPNEVNAFAGCDDGGAPFIAGTVGLLFAVDGIAQTKATDELFGTQTYDAYTNAVTPQLVSQQGGNAALPPNIIPPQLVVDARRLSRAHEMFDEVIGFTFGHELAHHYWQHTGCAHGQGPSSPPDVGLLGRLGSQMLPTFNQPNETTADEWGTINILDAGRARASQAYRWNEEGGLWLLDFFARMERAAGGNPLLGFLRSHPNPGLRIPVVQAWAATWRVQHPG
jgi:hypothetical protein